MAELHGPLTIFEALSESEFHYGECTRVVGPRGGVTVTQKVWRKNGMTKTWKRDPDRFSVPVKHGVKQWAYITHNDVGSFHPASRCPLRDPAYVTLPSHLPPEFIRGACQ